MPEQPPPPQELSYAQSLNMTSRLADALAVLTEPFVTYRPGKNHYGSNVLLGGICLMAWIVIFPRHELTILRFGQVWIAMVAFQVILARLNHHFGRRQITYYVGDPIIGLLLPFGQHFCRRVITPLLTFGVGLLFEDHALSLLIRASAIGQVVSAGIMYAVMAADDDARSDAMLNVHYRR